MFSAVAKAGWLLGLREKNKTSLPPIVKAGDPVFHEPAQEVDPKEIGSDKIKKTVDDMVKVMRLAPGVGLAAPQIGVPLRIIVLEDTKEYIRYQTKEEIKAQDRHPFDLLVILNQKLKKKSNRTALFFEGCLSYQLPGWLGNDDLEMTNLQRHLATEFEMKDLGVLSVDGYIAVVERNLDVEVTGFDCNGQPTKVDAKGWQARILQHECDHLDGTLYVDKMVSKTFRITKNLGLPLAEGCPKLGVR
ncbi:hypothetical protein JRO89_XS09G0126300 [Xanthoceras sorbifolium]|uniref:Peptide deformylase n=1 Tax=Xanthoceras sorbifolium TaxID=99658 RepID=A0ABQ8HL29_9ROSI|nr:hypothetical protein JRO89_XS09G0126300 [Xanthoceras sorbifolium]